MKITYISLLATNMVLDCIKLIVNFCKKEEIQNFVKYSKGLRSYALSK
jgi:hypothetical protein